MPESCRFKGYQDFTVQGIGLIAKKITYKLEAWQAPDGQVIRAKLPIELNGQRIRPFEEQSRIEHRGWSKRCQRLMTDFGAEESFVKAAKRMKDHHGISILEKG